MKAIFSFLKQILLLLWYAVLFLLRWAVRVCKRKLIRQKPEGIITYKVTMGKGGTLRGRMDVKYEHLVMEPEHRPSRERMR